MSENKKYFWLKLKDDFFRDKRIKKLRKIAGGDTFTIIYLKMQLLAIKNEGKLFFESVMDDFSEELALEIDEDVENVRVTVSFLVSCGLLEELSSCEYALPETMNNIGTETQGAERVRRHREKQKLLQCNTPVTICNTEIEKEKEIEIDNIVASDDTPKPVQQDLSIQVENIWALYPSKTGKAAAIKKLPKLIKTYGFDQLERVIDRYRQFVATKRINFPGLNYQNGSTFFNSGYVDFLDENFEETMKDLLSKGTAEVKKAKPSWAPLD